MFIILVYDVKEDRVGKALKTVRKYLNWVQNSVFEGELTRAQLERLKAELSDILNPDEDSVIYYKFRTKAYFERELFGVEKGGETNFI